MGNIVYKIPRINDEQIHHCLSELANEFGAFTVGINVGDSHIGQFTYPESKEPNLAIVLEQKSDLIIHFSTSVQAVTIAYYRGGMSGQPYEKSPTFDDLAIDSQGFDHTRVKIVARAIELFRPIQLPHSSDSISLLESQRALQESSFSRLQLQLEKVFEQTIDLRSRLDEQVRIKEADLEDVFKKKQIESSERIQKQADELANKEQALEDRSKSLDESDNTFARRQIRDRMLSDVSTRVQNFGLSDATVKARRPVAIGMACLSIFLLTLLVWTSFELSALRLSSSQATTAISSVATKMANAPASAPTTQQQATIAVQSPAAISESNGTERLLLWIRFSLISIGLAASILYYIRWQNQWASAYAATEFALQQFHIDVNRANWVVETCLEWRKETDSGIPSTLIQSLTRGLFLGKDTSPTVLHPADELASALMGSASKLSLDINGNKLDIDKPGKIPKTVPSSAIDQT